MELLTEPQVERLSAYIRENGVALDNLHDDLLDHLCTAIELRIQQGESFDAAFEHTIALFGPGGLQQVQQDTFTLLTQMNNTMKQVTFVFGLLSTFLLLTGTIFKIQHWPGANVQIMLGAVLLALVYLPIILVHKIKESKGIDILMHVLGYAGLAATISGVLFKVLHWPGAGAMLLGGMATLAFGYVPIYFFTSYRRSENRPIAITSSMIALACLILVFALMKSGNSGWYEHGVVRMNEELQQDVIHTSSLNTDLYERSDWATKAEFQSSTNALVDQIEALKIHLIAQTTGGTEAEAKTLNLAEYDGKHEHEACTRVLIGTASQGPSRGPYSAAELKLSLDAYRALYLQQFEPELHDAMDAGTCLRTDGEFTNAQGEKHDWAHHKFNVIPLFAVLSELSKLQVEVRQMETHLLMLKVKRPEPKVEELPG